MSLRPRYYVVELEGKYDNGPVRFKHTVEALDEATAVARVGYRIGKKVTELEIISVVVREA